MCRPCHTWCTRQRLPCYSQVHCNPCSQPKHRSEVRGKVIVLVPQKWPNASPEVQERKDTVSSCAFQEEHHKPLALLLIEKWLLHCHTCTLIFCITWSTNLGGKCWETLPSKIVSLLRNFQKEEVFHNPQRSRVTRKHKCIRFMCILPSLGPSHPRGAAEAAAVPPSNTSLQCQAQLLWPFLLVGYHAVN